MKLLCVGRHQFLADHIASLFRETGVDARPVVGLAGAAEVATSEIPDVVLCEYDLLATNPLGSWEDDAVLSQLPVVAVSLTRRPHEACAFDINGIAGFLYLPTLDREAAARTLAALARRTPDVNPVSPGAYTLPPVPTDRPATAR
ncbi:MAG: hypothetical protein H0X64_08980 [Gemmatimonadaceae bacterium]|nr:hypothetical protein [Gemmatimonadaceae bacterium]